MPPRKREVHEIVTLHEPHFGEEQQAHYLQGIALFNAGRYWHAHESWEAAWLPMGNGPEDDGEMFLRALIQLASGLHLKRSGRYKGAKNHFAKAAEKFDVMPSTFLGLDTVSLRVFARHQLAHFRSDFTCLLRRREE